MALRYCSLHGRLLSVTQQCWLPFPQDKMREIQAYTALLRATKKDASALNVMETGCDACAATFRQIAQISGDTDCRRSGEE